MFEGLFKVLAEGFSSLRGVEPQEMLYGVEEKAEGDLKYEGMEQHRMVLLRMTLGTMVPLMMMEMKAQGWSWSRITETARECGQVVAEKGDVIQFKTAATKAHPIGTAEAVGYLARGIACLSHARGGVRIFGLRFQSDYLPS